MSDTDEYGIKKDIDDDYIGVEKRRAEVHTTEDSCDDEEPLDRQQKPASTKGSSAAENGYDWSHTYDRGEQWDTAYDEEAPKDHDGRADTRTRFNAVEAPSDEREKWERLGKINDGMWNTRRSSQNASANKRRMVETFATRLDCSPHQKVRCEAVAESIDASHFAHYPMETIVLAIVSIVTNEDGRWIRDEDAFKDLLRQTDSSPEGVKKCRHLVKSKSGLV